LDCWGITLTLQFRKSAAAAAAPTLPGCNAVATEWQFWRGIMGPLKVSHSCQEKTKSMKSYFQILTRCRFAAVVLLAGSSYGLAINLPAAESAAKGEKAAARDSAGELKAMDAFLDSHAVIDDQLRLHPGLADDPEFLRNHPEYAAFVAAHPGVASQLKDHPRYFVRRALLAQRKDPITPAETKKLDAFLDQHPDVEKELTANPKLADDPKYLAAHDELRKFLNAHPKIGGDLTAKPKATMQREKALEKREAAKAAKSGTPAN
jgi:hypothetical protein